MFGLFTRFSVYPMNLVKTRLQARHRPIASSHHITSHHAAQMQQQHTLYRGTADAFSKIIRAEGVSGLYRGFHINAIAVLNSQLCVAMHAL